MTFKTNIADKLIASMGAVLASLLLVTATAGPLVA
jgi:hypothetical protein